MSDAPNDVTSVTVRPAGGAAPVRQVLQGRHLMHGRQHPASAQVKKLHHWERKMGMHLPEGHPLRATKAPR